MKSNFARTLIVLGTLCISYSLYLFYLRVAPNRLSFASVPTSSINKHVPYVPTAISIPSLSIQLPIHPAIVKNNTWETTDTGISYLITSTLPGKKGNSVFYGHNYESLLGKLPRIQAKDTIEITLSNGDHKKYTVSYTQIVTPDSTYIVDQTADERITLYTCTGFFDSKRFVVVAVPV